MQTEQPSVPATNKSEVTMNNYDDIINLPHFSSKFRPRMTMRNRAAQFAPFAALSRLANAHRKVAREMETEVEQNTTMQFLLARTAIVRSHTYQQHEYPAD